MKFKEMDTTLIFNKDRMLLNDSRSGVEVTVCHGDRLAVPMNGIRIGTCYGQFFCYLGFKGAEVRLGEDGEVQLEVKNVCEA